MTCYHPITAFRAAAINSSGRRSLVFDPAKAISPAKVMIPCGQCVGCRLERSRVWAVRCMHEASLHEDNCFITLTYSDSFLPSGGTLVKSDFQKFMKRLRKLFGAGVRYYYSGEYGEVFKRPHYHAILFGCDFSDKFLWRVNPNGDNCYRSPILERLWPFGQSEIGDVTFQSASYVSRYIMSKRTGAIADDYYSGRLPEYNDMSRRPGIGHGWISKFHTDVYPNDFLVLNGVKFRPPRFYDTFFELFADGDLERLKEMRRIAARPYRSNNTKSRLLVREKVKLSRIQSLIRSFES